MRCRPTETREDDIASQDQRFKSQYDTGFDNLSDGIVPVDQMYANVYWLVSIKNIIGNWISTRLHCPTPVLDWTGKHWLVHTTLTGI